MGRYFKNVNTLDELRRKYRELLKKHHPDNGGNVSDMQEVNAEYDRLFKVLKDRHEDRTAESRADGSTDRRSSNTASAYDWENDKALREALQKIITFEGIEIEITGQWIWVSGNTYRYKSELKEAGFRWASQKKQWHFHTEAYQKKSRKALSMEDIRSRYGSTKVNTMGMGLLEA